MEKIYVKIDGIHCNHCIEKITKELLKNKKIKEVSIKNNIACISYEKKLTHREIIDTISGIDYFTKEDYISDQLKDIDNRIQLKEFIIILALLILIWLLINRLFGYNIFNVIPNIDSSITYGMLFITGLLTSIHCISMCGAINLIAIVDQNKNYKRPILYNLGRVISYTIIGGIVGLIGSIFQLNTYVNGVIILLASFLMLFMSFKMLGIIDFKIPFIKFSIKNKTRNSFIIGLLNGLMPCGPLQAMQVYALSTGSFIKGSLSMLLFSIGTVPLMLFVGVFYHIIKGKGKIILNKIASVLILVLSIVMLNRGLLALGIDISKSFHNTDEYTISTIKNDYQEVEFDLEYNDYEDVVVQKGIPVKMIIHVDKKYLTGCNSELEIKDFHIKKQLVVGDNVIEFTPEKEGTYVYTCWMNMIKNTIKVVDDIDEYKDDERKPARLKEVTGNIVKATLDKNGNILIKEADITDQTIYISYQYEGVTIGLLAVRNSEGKVVVVVNTCQSCGGSPYAYFVQVGDKIQCQNCGNMFNIDDLDNLSPDGCNPIGIEERTDKDGIIIIGTEQLKKLKDKFQNWKGPKS